MVIQSNSGFGGGSQYSDSTAWARGGTLGEQPRVMRLEGAHYPVGQRGRPFPGTPGCFLYSLLLLPTESTSETAEWVCYDLMQHGEGTLRKTVKRLEGPASHSLSLRPPPRSMKCFFNAGVDASLIDPQNRTTPLFLGFDLLCGTPANNQGCSL